MDNEGTSPMSQNLVPTVTIESQSPFQSYPESSSPTEPESDRISKNFFESRAFLERFPNSHLRKIEIELRKNKEYWTMLGFNEPSNNNESYTLMYFSQQADAFAKVRDNLANAGTFGRLRFLQCVSDELDTLFRQAQQVNQLIEIDPHYKRNITIRRALEITCESGRNLKRMIQQAQFESTSSCLAIASLVAEPKMPSNRD